MYQRIISTAWAFLAAAAVASGQDTIPAAPPELPSEVSDPDLEVLTRGPVHEAFVEQISPDPVEGIITDTAPPEPVNEVAPDLRPDGDDVMWIPGYWFWDDERSDYVWISGVWRRAPPSRRWIPGYWKELDSRFQWVAGFWSSDAAEEVEYLDVPPESLETGPSSPAPSDDYFWSPGNWVWETNVYQWQPGTWYRYRDGWSWVTARWIWTPRGCIYVPGYWDYPLTRRGHLFAPVYYRAPIFRRAGYAYHPVCWIGYEPLMLHLFVRPQYNHLFFGDYYAPSYRQLHYTPCYSYHSRHRGYSSLYTYYQHHFRGRGIDYCGRVQAWHTYYASHADYRPAQTYRQQIHLASNGVRRQVDDLVRPFEARQGARIGGSRLVPVSSELNRVQQRQSNQFREISRQRNQFEVAGHDGERRNRTTNESQLSSHGRLTLPDQPLTARRTTANLPGKNRVPPEIVDANRALHSRNPLIRGQDPDGQTSTTRRRNNGNPGTSQVPRETRSPGNVGDLTSRARVRSEQKGDRALENSSQQSPRFRSRTTTSSNQSSPSSSINVPPVNTDRLHLPLSSDAGRRANAQKGWALPGSQTSPTASEPSRRSNNNSRRTTGPRFSQGASNQPSVQPPSGLNSSVTANASGPTVTAPANSARSSAGSPRGQRNGFGNNADQPSFRSAAPPTARRSTSPSPDTGRAFGSSPRSRGSSSNATPPPASSPRASRQSSFPGANSNSFGSSSGSSSPRSSGRNFGSSARSSSAGAIGNGSGSSAGFSLPSSSGRSIGAGAGSSSSSSSGRSIGAGARSSSAGSIGNRSSSGARSSSSGSGGRSSSSASRGGSGKGGSGRGK